MALNYETPDAVTHDPGLGTILVSTLSDVLCGPTTALTEFVVTGGGAPPNPTSINLIGGNVLLTNPGWFAIAPTNLAYTPGPYRYELVGPGVLETFSLPLPYP